MGKKAAKNISLAVLGAVGFLAYFLFIRYSIPEGGEVEEVLWEDTDFYCVQIQEDGLVNAISDSATRLLIVEGVIKRSVGIGATSTPIAKYDKNGGLFNTLAICKISGDIAWIETGGREARPETGIVLDHDPVQTGAYAKN